MTSVKVVVAKSSSSLGIKMSLLIEAKGGSCLIFSENAAMKAIKIKATLR